jgi:hypothetical protein
LSPGNPTIHQEDIEGLGRFSIQAGIPLNGTLRASSVKATAKVGLRVIYDGIVPSE